MTFANPRQKIEAIEQSSATVRDGDVDIAAWSAEKTKEET
jgi:hypothetical protein